MIERQAGIPLAFEIQHQMNLACQVERKIRWLGWGYYGRGYDGLELG